MWLVALASFVLGAISDWCDGFIARRWGLVTDLGKLLDPLADKILVCSGFIFMCVEGFCPAWVVACIVCREFLVTGLRQAALEKGEVIPADNMGKWKTTFQLIYIILTLVYLAFFQQELVGRVIAFVMPWGGGWWFFLSGAVFLTVASGISYLLRARYLFSSP